MTLGYPITFISALGWRQIERWTQRGQRSPHRTREQPNSPVKCALVGLETNTHPTKIGDYNWEFTQLGGFHQESVVGETRQRTNNMGSKCPSCRQCCGCHCDTADIEAANKLLAAADKLRRATKTRDAKEKQLGKARAALERIEQKISDRTQDVPPDYKSNRKLQEQQAAVAKLAGELDEMIELEKKCRPVGYGSRPLLSGYEFGLLEPCSSDMPRLRETGDILKETEKAAQHDQRTLKGKQWRADHYS